jgi:hypothetical protein
MMTENIQLAIQLLVVGMLSVSFILAIVTGLARLLIYLVNSFGSAGYGSVIHRKTAISPKKIAAIIAATDNITGGKAKIQSINKL